MAFCPEPCASLLDDVLPPLEPPSPGLPHGVGPGGDTGGLFWLLPEGDGHPGRACLQYGGEDGATSRGHHCGPRVRLGDGQVVVDTGLPTVGALQVEDKEDDFDEAHAVLGGL